MCAYCNKPGVVSSYHKDGLLHREGDLLAIEFIDGTKEWWLCGSRHRENGPAIEYVNGCKEWHQYGFLHRENGSAYENSFNDFYKIYARIIGLYYVVFLEDTTEVSRLDYNRKIISNSRKILNVKLPFDITEDKLKKLLIFMGYNEQH